MKAIVINPFDETIEEAIYLGHYKEIYSFLECRTFDCVYLDNREVLYIDDEGLLIEETKYFSLNNRIFAGKGLILGSDKDVLDFLNIAEALKLHYTLKDADTAIENTEIGQFAR